MTELKKACFRHSLLDDDIHDLAHGLTIVSVGAVDVLSVDSVLSFLLYFELNLSAHELGVNHVRLFVDLLSSPYVVSRVDVLTDEKLDFFGICIDNFGKLERCDRWSRARHLILPRFNNTNWILEDLRSILSNSHSELICSEGLLLDSSFLWVD